MKVAGVTTFTAAQIKAEIDAIFSAHAGGNFAHAALIAATLCNHHAPELADYVRARISARRARECHEALRLLASPVITITIIDDAPTPPPFSPPQDGEGSGVRSKTSDSPTVEVDAELMRILSALDLALPARLWAIARRITVNAQGSGVIHECELIAEAVAARAGTAKHLARVLRSGNGVFWKRISNGRIRITGYQRLSVWAVEEAHKCGQDDLIATNRPGTAFIHVPVGGSIKQWRANLYAAWFNHREPGRISRYTLQALWGVTTKTLIAWETSAGINAQKAYAYFTDDQHTPFDHAFPVALRQHGGSVAIGVMARISNAYHYPAMPQRRHKRTPRTVRRAVNQAFEHFIPSEPPHRVMGQPTAARVAVGVGLTATGKRHFEVTSDRKGDPIAQGFKRLRQHLRQDDNDDAPHYAFLGFRGKRQRVAIYEQSSDGLQRITPRDRLSRGGETAYFSLRGGRKGWMQAWRE